jgi:hypothetical protein
MTGKRRSEMESFQIENGYGEKITIQVKQNGGLRISGTFELSPLEAAALRFVSIPSVLSRTGVKPTKHEPLTKLNGLLSNIPKAKLASQY